MYLRTKISILKIILKSLFPPPKPSQAKPIQVKLFLRSQNPIKQRHINIAKFKIESNYIDINQWPWIFEQYAAYRESQSVMTIKYCWQIRISMNRKKQKQNTFGILWRKKNLSHF